MEGEAHGKEGMQTKGSVQAAEGQEAQVQGLLGDEGKAAGNGGKGGNEGNSGKENKPGFAKMIAERDEQIAAAAGVSVFTVRGYEQGKRTPNDERRVAIAKVLGVQPEVLTDFGITSPNEAFHFLREFAHIYYLAPKMGNIGPVVAEDRMLPTIGLPKRPSLNKLMKDWYFAWVEFRETGDAEKYQDWQDHYEG